MKIFNIKSYITFVLTTLFTLSVCAQIPAGYYNTAEGKTERGLKSTISKIISTGTKDVGYAGLYKVYETSDNTTSNNVWDMYSTCTWTHGLKKCGNYSSVCDCYNREHSIPQSWFGSKAPMVSDAFHVYPTDGKVNGQRSNYPFGECGIGTTLPNGKGKLGSSTFPGYSGTVFEPADEYKGDFARTYFYFATRYEDKISGFSGASFSKNTYPSLSAWSINLFLKWHRQDPVSEKEIDRNNAVHKHQKNRNPFIDYPELAEHIWGNKMNEAFYFTSGIEQLPADLGYTLFYANGELQILDNKTEGVIEIYTITGKLLTKQRIEVGNSNISIPQNELYIVRSNGVSSKLSTY